MRETQARKFTNSKKLSVYSCLLGFSATKITSWKCHVDNSTTVMYNIILGRDIPNSLVLDLKLSKNIVIGNKGPYEVCLATMIDVSNYNFKPLREKYLKHKDPLLIYMSMNASNPRPK